ncbi:MAG: T9SS type A sorting domain-containing protein [Ichthyobacteriaceae bacterium]|nr:T9SS type A sorting domain-containing protein [Ichthyobacteriaceae bacterium]
MKIKYLLFLLVFFSLKTTLSGFDRINYIDFEFNGSGWIDDPSGEVEVGDDRYSIIVKSGDAVITGDVTLSAIEIYEGATLTIASGVTITFTKNSYGGIECIGDGKIEFADKTSKLILATGSDNPRNFGNCNNFDPRLNGGVGTLEVNSTLVDLSDGLDLVLPLNNNNVFYYFGNYNTKVSSVSFASNDLTGYSGEVSANTFNVNVDMLNSNFPEFVSEFETLNIGNNIVYTVNTIQSCINVVVNAGGVLKVNNSFTATSLVLNSDTDGQAVVVGDVECNNVTMKAYLHHTGTTDSGDGKGWRQLNIPFNLSVSDVDFGDEFNGDIMAKNWYLNYHVDGADASYSKGSWTNKTGNDNSVKKPFLVWNAGGNTIVASKGKMSDSHNSDFTQILKEGHNFIPNPFVSYIDAIGMLNENKTTPALTVETVNEGVYKYWTIPNDLSNAILPPFQSFWVVGNEQNIGTSFNIIRSLQRTGHEEGSVPLPKQQEKREYLRLNLYVEDVIDDKTHINDIFYMRFGDNGSGIGNNGGFYDVKSFSKGSSSTITMNAKDNEGTGYVIKEYNTTELNSDLFAQKLNLLGTESKNLKISIKGNDLEGDYIVSLLDTKENKIVDLGNQDYSFNYSTNDKNDRFVVMINENNMLSENIDETSNVSFVNMGDNFKISTPNNVYVAGVSVLSINGSVVKNYLGSNKLYNTSNLTQGVYIAKIDLENGQSVTYKFIKG